MTALLRGYLIGYLFWLSIAMGSVALLQLHALTGGRWGRAARSVWEAAAWTVPWLALLFLPLAFGARSLYPWARGAPGWYLSLRGFWLRAALYWACWWVMSRAVRRGAPGVEAAAAASPALWGGVGLALYVVSTTFAAIDWGMSLEPAWGSTAYGLIVIAGQGVAALAFAALALGRRRVEAQALHDLGNLLLAFVMLWAYVSFSQYLIVWSGDLPQEVAWYAARTRGSWGGVAAALSAVQFAAPFALLLWRSVKRSGAALAALGAALLLGRWLDLWWLIAPSFSPARLGGGWASGAGLLLVGLPWLALFERERRRRLEWERP